jgi:DNA recombination protein RmuC
MALLMGFRTLAIQKRSADIANLLGAVKNDFGKFSDLLGKVEEKLDDAKTNIGKARQRSTQIVKKLGKVEELPHEQATLLLPDPSSDPDAIVTDDQD